MKTNIKTNENMNEVQNQSVNPAVEGENQQTSTEVSSVENVAEADNVNAEPVKKSTKKGSKRDNIQKSEKKYEPEYSDEKKEYLDFITAVAKESIQNIINNPDIPTIPFGDHNCLINLTEAYKNGVNLLTPVVNRKHGKDLEKTGESIRTYGAQRTLLVDTKEVCDAAGIEVKRFDTDTHTGELKDTDLVVKDGNGRVEYMLGLPEKDMATLWATFIEPDALGYYNPSKVMEVINTELSVWKTPEHLQKRLLEEGQEAHEGWSLVQQLVKNGYMYQAACMAYTLDTDRIKVRKVNCGDANEVFAHIESAKKIHAALVDKFGEGDDKVLKTKEFPKEVSILWRKLKDYKDDENWATDTFVEFIKQFKDNKIQDILNAKTTKGELNKDEIRKKILNEQFNQFIGRNGIDLD